MNPVLVNDLRKSLVRRKPVHVVAYMALAIVALVFSVSAFVPSSTSPGGGTAYPLWRYPDLLLPLLAPAFAAGAFAKEHEQRTWQDVVLTRLSGGEILRGKMLACIVPICISMVVLFPAFLLALIVQDVTWAMDPGPWMILWSVKLVVSIAFYVSAAMVCSYYSPNPRVALAVTYCALGLYAALNYLAWILVIDPLVLQPMMWNSQNHVGNTQMFSGYSQPAYDPSHFTLAPVDWLILIQSLLLAIGMVAFLAVRLRRRTM